MAKESKNLTQAAKNTAPLEQPLKPLEVEVPRFVRLRKRRRAAWIVLGVSFAGCLVMAIVAFLGQNFGRYTIRLDNSGNATLTMAQNLATQQSGSLDIEGGTTFLDLRGLSTNNLTQADDLPAPEELDSDVTESNLAAKKALQDDTSKYYFVYTFYLKNLGAVTVPYNASMNVESATEPTNLDVSCSLESIIRIRVFENVFVSGNEPTHNMVTYAKKKTVPKGSSSDFEPQELISKANAEYSYNQGYATNFLYDDGNPKDIVVFSGDREIEKEQIIRYTIVMWLEGNDPDCDDVVQPDGGTLSLAMHFTAQ